MMPCRFFSCTQERVCRPISMETTLRSVPLVSYSSIFFKTCRPVRLADAGVVKHVKGGNELYPSGLLPVAADRHAVPRAGLIIHAK